MENKIKQIKKEKVKKEEEPKKKEGKPNIFNFAKSQIDLNSSKLNKLIAKLEKSIANHDKEKTDKELALKECQDELKVLHELAKQA
jgi:hypothetical protein